MNLARYPPWIGQKFNPDGTVLPFPGNTIICSLSEENDLYHRLLTLVEQFEKQDFALRFALLPPTSWHMTLFEGVCDNIREPELWPAELPLDATLHECTSFIEQKLQNFDSGCDSPFHMNIEGWESLKTGIALTVAPASEEEEARLREVRDRLAVHLGIRAPDHEGYIFHISLTYTLRYLTEQEELVVAEFLNAHLPDLPSSFELESPEFCVFDDMTAFHRRLFLERS